jgi:arylsulfatase A-like enzyme
VHGPFESKEDVVEKYRKKVDPENPQKCPTMGAMIEVMDNNIGRVLDYLDQAGLAKDTIVIFASDNGGCMYEEVEGNPPTNNYPLRNGKGSIYEGGIRVPMIIKWPGNTKANSISEEIVNCMDIYPTILEIAGLDLPENQVIDGVSLIPTFKGDNIERDYLACHFPHYVPVTDNVPATSVRKGDWKLIRFWYDGEQQNHRYELYNLSDDIGEKDDLSEQYLEKVKKLDQLISKHLKETNSLLPGKNPEYEKDD